MNFYRDRNFSSLQREWIVKGWNKQCTNREAGKRRGTGTQGGDHHPSRFTPEQKETKSFQCPQIPTYEPVRVAIAHPRFVNEQPELLSGLKHVRFHSRWMLATPTKDPGTTQSRGLQFSELWREASREKMFCRREWKKTTISFLLNKKNVRISWAQLDLEFTTLFLSKKMNFEPLIFEFIQSSLPGSVRGSNFFLVIVEKSRFFRNRSNPI